MIIGLSWKICFGNKRFELFDFELLRVRPRPLNVRGHLISKQYFGIAYSTNATRWSPL